jgi:hypothetical protein
MRPPRPRPDSLEGRPVVGPVHQHADERAGLAAPSLKPTSVVKIQQLKPPNICMIPMLFS